MTRKDATPPAARAGLARVLEVAQETNTSLNATATLYTRIAASGRELGLSNQQVLGLVETINQAIQVSGAGAQESEAAIRQLVQGLQSGVLRGEEFNSVLEQAPRLRRTSHMKPNALYTLGYEGLEVAAFIARLRSSEVRTVVDVRELPLSRKKGFSKTAFSEALGAAGIAYLHMPTLGCPKEVRDAYKVDGDWARYTRGFMKHLQQQEASVRDLAKIAASTTACLVCFEADYSGCHRTYVGRAAQRAGAPQLKHLTARTVFVDRALRLAA